MDPNSQIIEWYIVVQQKESSVRIKLHSVNSPSGSLTLNAHILSQLTAWLPSTTHSKFSWPEISGLPLADPEFLTANPIDLILGADQYSRIIKSDIIRHPRSDLIAQNTQFGWVILGPIPSSHCKALISIQNTSNEQIQQSLVKFWELEEALPTRGPNQDLSPDELTCERHFLQTHSRSPDGRYVVRLPFAQSPSSLGNSFHSAKHSLLRLHKQLDLKPAFSDLYHDFMSEYRSLNHLFQISHPEIHVTPHFYLPHHGIMKTEGSTSKIRVVFNGSRKTSSGPSLNDILLTGAKLQNNIFDVLLYFRQFRYVFITDITKMFRQILMHPDDRRFQRILWLDKKNDTIPYELSTVTYGTSSAPFLAGRVLNQLVQDEGSSFPLAVEPMTQGRYVDDISGGADSLDQLLLIARQVINLCKAGGFPLAKWKSNHPEFFSHLTTEPSQGSEHIFDSADVKILGLLWIPQNDSFKFDIKLASPDPLTKRIILSNIASIFDPLGLISPVVIQAKILLQRLWLEKLDWDEPVSSQLSERWLRFQRDLSKLSHLQVPRWLSLSPEALSIQLHGFSDASRLALSATVYLKVVNQQSPTVQFICARTKVAPLKPCTIPRLELSACVLLIKLLTQVLKTLTCSEFKIFCWTDSNVALSWIKEPPSRWKDFVRNRVHFIQETLPQVKWLFVPGKENPADCASRGLTSSQLLNHSLWWNGPPWLPLDQTHWPKASIKNHISTPEEERPGTALVINISKPRSWDLINKFSSIHRLLRVTAICQRAVKRFRGSAPSLTEQPLSAYDIQQALNFWIHSTQQSHFADSINHLSKNQPLPTYHPLSRLTPFLDHTGTLRIGGRLKNSLLDPDSKHPIILPRSSPLSDLLITDCHLRTLHGTTQSTLALLRQNYWILGGRTPIRSHILRCTSCARHRSIRAQQLMGQLPAARVNPSRPFSHTGVDYAGPVLLKTKTGRGAKTFKGWLVIFVCFSTSAVHLDVVSDYSANAFLAAYRRLTGRRGICQVLYSDCGTTFQGADSALKALFSAATQEQAHLSQQLLKDGTSWKFNPPAAPHFGGKWEAAVKSVKHHLRRTIGDSSLTFEELSTLLVQIESVLNSRPLSALSDDPDDLSSLTPGHFLIGEALNTIPEPSLQHLPTSRLNSWQFIQQRLQYFWSRWSSECLHRYMSISKWFHPQNNIQLGSLVLLTDEHSSPSKWPLGRVTELHPGSDGLTRVVTIKTASTKLKRPITKLAILPPLTQDTSDYLHSVK